jgi:hypothetical protein
MNGVQLFDPASGDMWRRGKECTNRYTMFQEDGLVDMIEVGKAYKKRLVPLGINGHNGFSEQSKRTIQTLGFST